MRFKYLLHERGHIKPVLPMRIAVADRWVDVTALVDSGADTTILNAEIAKKLGIVIEDGEPALMTSATGHEQDIFMHNVQLAVGPITYGAKVAFAQRSESYGLAGQLGSFDQFRISFDRRAEEFTLHPYEARVA